MDYEGKTEALMEPYADDGPQAAGIDCRPAVHHRVGITWLASRPWGDPAIPDRHRYIGNRIRMGTSHKSHHPRYHSFIREVVSEASYHWDHRTRPALFDEPDARLFCIQILVTTAS